MARYRIDDTTIVDTKKAQDSWDEATRWNGNNEISKATGSQWEHETLYLSQKGRWYIVHTSQWQGSTPHARWATEEEAGLWLLQNNHDLPDSLEHVRDTISE